MSHPFSVNSNIEIHKEGHLFLNAKRVELLKLIKEHGSISAASRQLKMSYQQAWHYIKSMNELAPIPMVVRQRGGANGGGALLTQFAEKAIAEFRKLEKSQENNQQELNDQLWLRFF